MIRKLKDTVNLHHCKQTGIQNKNSSSLSALRDPFKLNISKFMMESNEFKEYYGCKKSLRCVGISVRY